MSWDILIINSEIPVDFESGEWENFKSKEQVIENIKQTFPESKWTDSEWGIIENDNALIEFNIGSQEIGNNFMLHVRNGLNPTIEIVKLCRQHSWNAYDISNEEYINLDVPNNESFGNWESYKNQILKTSTTKPWWKFW